LIVEHSGNFRYMVRQGDDLTLNRRLGEALRAALCDQEFGGNKKIFMRSELYIRHRFWTVIA
jgi:hypothetical protein